MSLDDAIRISELLRNLRLALAGVVGALFAGWSAYAANRQARTALEQHGLARRDHVTEMFDRAVAKLADDKLEVRLGASYTLIALYEDSVYADYTGPVMDTLTAYVRERAVDGVEMSPDIAAIQKLVLRKTAL